jgi:enoyl-CoA hydratase/carnithine racemase
MAGAGTSAKLKAMASELLKCTMTDGVADVVIDHPPTNLVDGAFIGALAAILDRLDADDTVRVVVFASADPDFFLMHGDVHGILTIPAGSPAPASAPNVAAAMFARIRRSPFVSIGVLDGAARGGGAEFLTALDLRYGSDRGVLGQPEVAMGILPGAGGTTRLPHLLGRSRALEVILSGRDVHAEEALRIGWLDGVFPSESLADDVRALARHLAAMPAGSIAAVKRVVDASLISFDAALVDETNAFGELTGAGAHVEPMQRFLAAGGQTREGELDRWDEIMRTTRGDA